MRLSAAQLAQFARYRDELLDCNQRLNLTAIRDPTAVEELLFLDSLACLLVPVPQGAAVLDVGSGAGLPGLPLKIARPDLQLTLLEATGKKARFLEHVVASLGLADVTVAAERAETASGRGAFDVVAAKAVADMAVLLELTLPFVTDGGLVLAHKKGMRLAEELRRADRALLILGGQLEPPRHYELGGEERQIVVVRKVRPTPPEYPRRPGVPARQPL